LPPEFSEDRLALELAAKHQDDLRYVANWGRWLQWQGSRWAFDDTLNIFTLARALRRAEAARCKTSSTATAIVKAKTVAAIEQLARSDDRLKATTDQWDADPWSLNTPGGIVDLRTGSIRPASPKDYCTKSTAVAPSEGDPCLFLNFLDRIVGGDAAMIAYLQRVFGYSLTGLTREHALFFGHGTGANGKSVLLSTVSGILCDYHKIAPIETFTASNSDRHPTELAGLRGARLVTAVETEEGRRWAESRIKQLTGGEVIAARFMRQDFFEYQPQFKLLIAGNHKPSLRSVDEAIRRRLHLIPFNVTIPPGDRDPELTEKLKEEWPRILAWMIAGCLEWQRAGLAPPEVVRDATESYFEAQDAVAVWIEDRCVLGASCREPRTALYLSWSDWSQKAGEFSGNQKTFFEKLDGRGFRQVKLRGTRLFEGLKLRE
jgi:putative DNA primase/helicase